MFFIGVLGFLRAGSEFNGMRHSLPPAAACYPALSDVFIVEEEEAHDGRCRRSLCSLSLGPRLAFIVSSRMTFVDLPRIVVVKLR